MTTGPDSFIHARNPLNSAVMLRETSKLAGETEHWLSIIHRDRPQLETFQQLGRTGGAGTNPAVSPNAPGANPRRPGQIPSDWSSTYWHAPKRGSLAVGMAPTGRRSGSVVDEIRFERRMKKEDAKATTPLAPQPGPISILDLPKIANAIEELIRAIERADALAMRRAGDEIVALLMPSRGCGISTTPFPDISNSPFDISTKAEFIDMCHGLTQFAWPEGVLANRERTIVELTGVLPLLRNAAITFAAASPPTTGQPPKADAKATPPDLDPARFRHGPDYCDCTWNGKDYIFTATQAACVRVFWEERDKGTRELRQDYVLQEAGSYSNRLQDIFKGHPAWKTMIVQGSRRGIFRLADPE